MLWGSSHAPNPREQLCVPVFPPPWGSDMSAVPGLDEVTLSQAVPVSARGSQICSPVRWAAFLPGAGKGHGSLESALLSLHP